MFGFGTSVNQTQNTFFISCSNVRQHGFQGKCDKSQSAIPYSDPEKRKIIGASFKTPFVACS